MKLYSADLSPYSAKVRMQIYAKGIEDIRLAEAPGFRTPNWVAISPTGRIPALELADGDIIPESEVIAEYLEELYPEPRMLGSTPRETAAVRAVSRMADLYLANNMYMLASQTRRSTRNDAIRDLLAGEMIRGARALEHYIGDDGFAVGGRLSLADCTLVPALFLVENLIASLDVENPIPALPKLSGYWTVIQANLHAARVLAEMRGGLQARRDAIRAAAALS